MSIANGSQDHGQVSGIITPISIHKYRYLSANAIRCFEALQTGSSITTYGFAGDDCSSLLSYICCSIGTAIINHNHPLRDVLGELCKQMKERLLLVQSGYDDCNLFGYHKTYNSSTIRTISNIQSSFVHCLTCVARLSHEIIYMDRSGISRSMCFSS